MSMMLASVANAGEARIALDCDVDWIDVKDPAAGALGAASVATVAEIVELVAGTVPVSATIGDCWDEPEQIARLAPSMRLAGVDYVKAALNAFQPAASTLVCIERAVRARIPLILVCAAEAPPTAADVAALAATGVRGIMLDTANKAGAGLAGLVTPAQAARFVTAARQSDLLTGLAGRLTVGDIAAYADAPPDYFGFRSALCAKRERAGELCRVSTLTVRRTMNKIFPDAVRHSSEVA